MKSNKIKEFFNKDINFFGQAKYYLSVLGAILISAVIIISVIGLNLGFDVKGGTIVEVVYGIEFDANGDAYPNGAPYDENLTKEKIEKVVSLYGNFEKASVQTVEGAYGSKVVYKLTSNKALTNEECQTLQAKLYEEFNSYDANSLLQSKYISAYSVPGTASDIAIYSSIALSVSIVLLFLGAMWRYGLSAGFALLITSILNVLACFATVIICRITVNTGFIGSVLTVFALTLVSNLVLLDKIRSNKNCGLTRKEIGNLSVKQSFVINALILSVSIICSVLLTGFGVLSIREFGVPVIVGCIFAFLSTVYVTPFFWTLINFKKSPRKNKKSK